eukprot:5719632-Prymnesium_polylepis.2
MADMRCATVSRSWGRIDSEWRTIELRMRQLRAIRFFSHYVWPIHIHDLINATASGEACGVRRGANARPTRGASTFAP